MPRPTETPFPLTKSRARAHLAARAAARPRPRRSATGREATRAAVEHLGYVQIDTINVIERCHHHILYTRIPGYRREHLRQAQSVDKTVFEYWTHALSYVPTRDLRFYRRRHEAALAAPQRLVQHRDAARTCARCCRASGAGRRSPIRDIDDDVLVEKDHAWASRKPSKRALQLAFYRGRLTVSQRTGMLKTYELMTGTSAGTRLPKAGVGAADPRLSARPRAAIAGRRQPRFDLLPRRPAQAGHASSDRSRVRRKELVPVALEGAGKLEHWRRPETLDAASTAPKSWSISCRRSIRWSISASGCSCSSATSTASRLMCPRRSGCSATSRCPCWSATTSSRPRPQDRSRAAEAAAAALDLAGQELTPIAQETDRRGAAPVRTLPARALTRS